MKKTIQLNWVADLNTQTSVEKYKQQHIKRCLSSLEIQMKSGMDKVKKGQSQKHQVLTVHTDTQKE